MRLRPDETWHRLQDWTYGQTPSERLSAHLLHSEGYTDIDPTHPLGGPDGGKDALCSKGGHKYVMAVYFPRGRISFSKVKKKYLSDLSKAREKGVFGIAFVVNQELTDRERGELRKSANPLDCDIFHLERITHILDRPEMKEIKDQYLYIEDDQINKKDLKKLEDSFTGGDTFCRLMLYYFDMEANFANDIAIIKEGKNSLYNINYRIMDIDSRRDVINGNINEINAPALMLSGKLHLSDNVYLRVFFSARNGFWTQDLILKKSARVECWLVATRIKGRDGRTIWLEYTDNGFIDEFGPPSWRP